jgi:7,8-dihydroneopterin aldolase/epimerase/oxygenase
MTTITGDRIFLRGLECQCIIGFIDWERRVKQKVVLDLEFPTNCTVAAARDEVSDTVDYKRVAKCVLAYVGESQFQLIETLAHNLAMLLLREFSLEWIRVSLNKPGAIRHSRDIGVSIERRRTDLASGAKPAG